MQDVIEGLKSWFRETANQVPDDYDIRKIWSNRLIKRADLLIEIVIPALERQTPKPPTVNGYKCKFYSCPVCKRILYAGQRYCDDCGQIIDWRKNK